VIPSRFLLALQQPPGSFEWNLVWPGLASSGGRVVLSLLIGWAAYRGLRILTARIERKFAEPGPGSIEEQRVHTLVGLVRSVGVAFILVLTFFMVLGGLGMQIGPLLAGAGVAGLAISFGAQSLVRDVISGMFILLENQFGVGDVVRIGDVGGMVERMTLRIVVLRDVHGVVHTIPNGEIKRVSNMTRAWSRAVIEVDVAYREDTDRVMDTMREIGREMWEQADWRQLLVEESTVPGIEAFGSSGVTIRMMAKTLPLKQWDVSRELRRRIKRRFDADGIEIPFPHRTLFWGAGQVPDGGASPVGLGDGEARE
jgi:moderate conductance mechanosensitive channel